MAESLLHQKKVIRGRPSRSSIDASHSAIAQKGPATPIPNRSIRTEGYQQWAEFCKTKSRCQHPGCKGIQKVKFSQWDVRLRFTINSNCFKKFHE